MQPFEIRLSYNGKSWCTVELEVGHDEIGDADDPEFFLSPDVASMFETLGLPKPSPVPLMPIPFQIAQKLHGATGPGSRRAHDLVDLQLILARGEPDWKRTREICVRLFAYRKQQTWPPAVVAGPEWPQLYAIQSANVSVLPSVEEAIAWTQRLVGRIDAARGRRSRPARRGLPHRPAAFPLISAAVSGIVVSVAAERSAAGKGTDS